MSYQSPYQPPPPNYGNFNYYQQDMLAPARRAGMLMLVLGALSLGSSLCCGGFGLFLPQLMERPEFASAFANMPGMSVDEMRVEMIVSGVIALVAGTIMILLGVLVWRGKKTAAIIAVVFIVLAALFIGVNVVSALVMARNGSSQLVGGACVLAVLLAILILQTVWLFGAIRAADHAAGQQYAMQYWQYAQQQQQAYGQQPYGSPPAPPSPPPASPPPSGDSAAPPR